MEVAALRLVERLSVLPYLHFSHQDWESEVNYTYISAIKTGKVRLTTGNVQDSTFISGGFPNWKDANI